MRMPVNVGPTLLKNSEQSNLDGLRQAGKVGRNVQRYGYSAALRKPSHEPAGSRGEAGFIQQRWMEQVRERTRLGYGLVENVAAFVQDRIIARSARAQHFNRNFQPRQILSQAVMELARNPATLLVLDAQQPSAQFAQSVLGIAAGSYIHGNDANLREDPTVFPNRKVVDHPMANCTRISRQCRGNLAVEYGPPRAQHFPQQHVGFHSRFAENLTNGFPNDLLRLEARHSRQYIVTARVPELRIQNAKAHRGRREECVYDFLALLCNGFRPA